MLSPLEVLPDGRSGETSAGLPRSVCLQFLAASQNSDGGWGYHPGSESGVEPTAWALMALAGAGSDQDFGEASVRGFEWLDQVQLPDSSWPAFKGQREGCWATSLASLALVAHNQSSDRVASAAKWLVETWPADASLWRQIQRRLSRGRSVARQNPSLHGWSWTPGTASWVEPTAYALILLSSIPKPLHPQGTAKRMLLAESMLYDRMCPGGGWNTGNPEVYGVAGLARVGPTAWALLGLRKNAGGPDNQQSLDWLEDQYSKIRGGTSLALAALCLTAYGRRAPSPASALGRIYLENRFFQSVLVFAWAALALGGMLPWNSIAPAQVQASES